MFSLEDLLGQQQGTQTTNQISQMLGANPTVTQSAIQMALPMILSGLARNASQPEGAESLSNALEENHDGGILNNLGGYLNNSSVAQNDDGIGILGHIFGQNQGAAAQQVSKNSGLDVGQVAQLLITLAPIVMGYLGRQKQQQNLDAGGLSNLLNQQQQQMQSSGNPLMDMVSSFMDSNHDGSAMDDIASLAANYLSRR
ncbi:MAG: DUF937 domain-containing protein [Acidobacteriota bacterium]|nr:DUF937 domain-containing protein [Acidobacteriota bacterium]